MNRLFVVSLVSVLFVYVVLFLYDNSEEPRLDTVISGGLALGFLFGAVHMLIDRTWREWHATAVAILMLLVSVGTLFGLLFYQRQFGRLDTGTQQGWLDVVRAAAIIGMPLFLVVIGRYRWQKLRDGDAVRPSDQITKDWKPGDPDRRTFYRRAEDRALRGIE